MRDSRNSAAAPFRMTVFQQMCDLIAVLAVNGHFKAVAVFLDLFCSPALFVISFLTAVAVFFTAFFMAVSASSAYSVSPFMTSDARSSIDVILRTCLSGFADQLHIVLRLVIRHNAFDVVVQTVKADAIKR